PQERRLILARDRFGEKPLFWGCVGLDDGSRVLAFSSELRTFTQLPGGPPAVDPLGGARYLVYDGMPDTRTVYHGVSKVAAGAWVEIDLEGRIRAESSFWEFVPEPTLADPDVAWEQLLGAMARSLDLRLRSDVPVGLFL